MGGPLIIPNPNVIFSFCGPLKHDEHIMSLSKPSPTLKLDSFHYPIQEKSQEMEL